MLIAALCILTFQAFFKNFEIQFTLFLMIPFYDGFEILTDSFVCSHPVCPIFLLLDNAKKRTARFKICQILLI